MKNRLTQSSSWWLTIWRALSLTTRFSGSMQARSSLRVCQLHFGPCVMLTYNSFYLDKTLGQEERWRSWYWCFPPSGFSNAINDYLYAPTSTICSLLWINWCIIGWIQHGNNDRRMAFFHDYASQHHYCFGSVLLPFDPTHGVGLSGSCWVDSLHPFSSPYHFCFPPVRSQCALLWKYGVWLLFASSGPYLATAFRRVEEL